ncbi:MAG: flagellar filament capping protein FliD [Acidihalobacter sp.]|uniref:flagellar filament capping protein FliD n=1 Tax=Acidihalobacter sp. TaxID=1872108 RepID=UPI00307E3B6B
MSGTVSSPGIGSGLDISSIVSKLLQADFGAQQNQIQNRQTTLNSELSAFGTINSHVSSINDSLTTLTDLKQSYSASSSDPGVVNVSTQDGAAPGSFNVNVSKLASAQSVASSSYSSPTSTVGTGTLTFQFGSYASGSFVANSSSPVQVTIDSSNDTLQGVAGAINEADFGVSATVVNDGSGYRLALTSKTGTENQLNITSPDSSLSGLTYDGGSTGMTETATAADAQLSINGVSVTSQSNTISDAVQGVSFTLGATGSSTVSVAPDSSAVTNAVQAFVKAYNSYAQDVSKYASYDSKTKTAGVLLGDATLRGLTSQLQNGVAQRIAGAPSGYSTLMDLGITANADGTLSLDTSKLTSAIASNYSGVLTALQSAGTQLGGVVSSMTGTNGIITARTDSINQQLTGLQSQLTALNARMQQEQQSLLQQYNAMDTTVANLKNTGSYLTQMLASLPGSSSSSGSSKSSSS